jgi:hypothetical protein
MLDNIDRSLEDTSLVLHPNLDQLERSHHKTLGSTRKAPRSDREGLRVFALAIVGEDGAPPSCWSLADLDCAWGAL